MRNRAKFPALPARRVRTKAAGLLSLTLATGLTFSPFAGQISPAHADYSRPIDVISISWPGSSALATSISSVRAGIQSNAAPYWKREANIDFTRGMDLSAPLAMNSELPCNGDATVNYLNDVAKKFYLSQGLNPGTRYLVILAPMISKNCVWAAKTIVGDYRIPFGISVLQDNAVPFVITHELGHTLGLGHTNLMSCPQAGDNLWPDCKNIEYGGSVDIMGNVETDQSLNIYHKWRVGDIPSSDIQSITQSGKFLLNDISSTSGLRGLFIHDGADVYWIEYRKAYGTFKAGFYIYRSDTPINAGSTSSVNPEYAGRYVGDSSGDVWLLNLDNYAYSSHPTGSPSSLSFTTLSGNVQLASSEVNGQLEVEATVSSGVSLQELPPSPLNITKYNFATSDLGSLYQISPVVDGTSLADPTLQICNARYTSEAHRVARSQVEANPLYKTKYSFISSEAVQYESSSWANRALRELTSVASKCSEPGTQIRFLNFKASPNVSSLSLISTSKSNGLVQNLLATFQVKGKLMVGTYVLSPTSFSAVEITKWQSVAVKVGRKL